MNYNYGLTIRLMKIMAEIQAWFIMMLQTTTVFSQTARGANKELKDYILSDEGYTWMSDDYKWKERVHPTEIWVTMASGKKKKRTIDASALRLDEEKIKAQEALDGYYLLITSKYKKTASEIIDIYRGLWKIEESFKVTKSDLKSRPVYVSTEDHIKAHFLTCFIALVLERILEFSTGGKYNITKMIQSLMKSTCTNVDQNYYLFDYYDEVLKDIGNATNVNFNKDKNTSTD